MQTQRLTLVPQTVENVRARIEALSPADRAQVSPDWLARLESAPDPWMLGFLIVLRESGKPIGDCGFKGPPTREGMVEIAYSIDPEYRGRGHATEAVQALVDYASKSGQVHVVLAHTLPEANASTRVLTRCEFTHMGEVIDPEDGKVWRWEKRSSRPSRAHDSIGN